MVSLIFTYFAIEYWQIVFMTPASAGWSLSGGAGTNILEEQYSINVVGNIWEPEKFKDIYYQMTRLMPMRSVGTTYQVV